MELTKKQKDRLAGLDEEETRIYEAFRKADPDRDPGFHLDQADGFPQANGRTAIESMEKLLQSGLLWPGSPYLSRFIELISAQYRVSNRTGWNWLKQAKQNVMKQYSTAELYGEALFAKRAMIDRLAESGRPKDLWKALDALDSTMKEIARLENVRSRYANRPAISPGRLIEMEPD